MSHILTLFCKFLMVEFYISGIKMSENCWDVVLSFSLCCARVQGLDEPAQHVLGMVTYLQSHMRETEYHKKQRKRSGHCVISAHCTGEWGRRMSVCAVVCQSWHPVAHALEKTDGWRLRRGVGDGVYEVVVWKEGVGCSMGKGLG